MTDFDEAAHPRAREGTFTEKVNGAPTGTLPVSPAAAACCECCGDGCTEAHQTACDACSSPEGTVPAMERRPARPSRRTGTASRRPTLLSRTVDTVIRDGQALTSAATTDLKSAMTDIFD